MRVAGIRRHWAQSKSREKSSAKREPSLSIEIIQEKHMTSTYTREMEVRMNGAKAEET